MQYDIKGKDEHREINIHVLQCGRSRDHKGNQIRCKEHSDGLSPHLAGIVCLVFTTGPIILLSLKLTCIFKNKVLHI